MGETSNLERENQNLKASLEQALKGMISQLEACDTYRVRAEKAEFDAKRYREALLLAEGRITLLLQNYPDDSDTCDHPIATKYVLSRVRDALKGPSLDV